ncbi:MAG: glycosyltransferase [Ferruginibacter sp.]|nr:glycosyltransferase [Ferruginibacter sp.]
MAEGNEVFIYTFTLQYPSFLFPGKTQYSSEPAPKNLTIIPSINSINPLNWWKVGKALRRLQPNLIVVRYWLPFMGPALGTILRQAKKNIETKVVCIADNIIPHEKRPGDKWFTRYFIKPVDTFITMSEKVMSDLRKFSQKPAQVISHPLYDNFGDIISQKDARQFLGIPEEKKIILFFGFIRAYKGLDMLLEAMHLLKEKYANQPNEMPQLLIAGEFYENRERYDELIKKFQLTDSLILHTDFIPDSEVKFYLCAADVVAQPYHRATQSGVTPLAYYFEVPMVVTPVGNLPNMVPDNIAGLIAQPNAISFSDTLIRYFEIGKAHFLPGIKEEKKKYQWTNLTRAIWNS